MRNDNMHKAFTALLIIIVLMCAAVLIKANTSKNEESSFDPEPIVINTNDDVLLTVIDEQGHEVFQYAGEVKDWTVEGERYMNIYINRVGEE